MILIVINNSTIISPTIINLTIINLTIVNLTIVKHTIIKLTIINLLEKRTRDNQFRQVPPFPHPPPQFLNTSTA